MESAAPEEQAMDVSVLGLAGELCTLRVLPRQSLLEVKQTIAERTEIPEPQQSLCVGGVQLDDLSKDALGAVFRELLPQAVDTPLQLSLVRRDAEEATWLENLRECDCDFDLFGDENDIESLLRNMPHHLRGSRDVMLAAVGTGLRFDLKRYAEPVLWNDRGFVLKAVRLDGLFLQHAGDLRSNPEVVMVAVTQNGLALQWASNDLQANARIVLAALRNAPGAIDFVYPELRTYDEVRALVPGPTVPSNREADQESDESSEDEGLYLFG